MQPFDETEILVWRERLLPEWNNKDPRAQVILDLKIKIAVKLIIINKKMMTNVMRVSA